MPRGVPLREGLLVAFARILSHARSCTRRAAEEPEESVHEFRKSVRRARALVSLVRPSLGKGAALGIAAELRRAFAETGPLRDADILLATLRSVPVEDPHRAAVEETLERERLLDGASAAAALNTGSRILQPLPGALRVTLPRDFAMDDLARGIARGYRRSQDALQRAAETRLLIDLHEWRKRVKELRYEIELLASSGSSESRDREKKLSALAEDLGRVTDLVVLLAALGGREKAGTIPRADALVEAIRADIGTSSQDLIARGEELFAEAPTSFARQVLAERG
jgi:CHAD domain-containing protein